MIFFLFIDRTRISMTKTEDIKVIVLPQGPYIETGTSIISLPHPNNVSMLFMLSTSQLLQLQKFSNTTNSWVIGERIVQNGDLYTATPFDLNFLLIPLLDGKDNFVAMDDILFNDQFPHLQELHRISELSNNLMAICDTTRIDDQTYFRLSNDKLLIWLKKKVSSLLKDMENLEALKLFKKETVDEQHKLAIRLLSDNLQKSHVDMLLKEFNLTDLKDDKLQYFQDSINKHSLGTDTGSSQKPAKKVIIKR
ncbi:ribonuclease H2, subunit B [Globomyces pollinis-pini]|nr:ribonuclease H2, subunit B [Globomyces pollinis-pini]